MRQLRAKVRLAPALGGTAGAQAALFLTSKRLNAHQRNGLWIEEPTQLLPNLDTTEP